MAAADAKPIPIKNTAFRVTFAIYDQEGDLVPNATGLDSEVSLDAGTFADCTNEATEIATNSGIYYLDLTDAEMNADTVAIIVKTTSTGAKTTALALYPAENTDIPVNVTALSGDTTAADNAESFFDGTGYAGTNNVIPSVTTVTGNVNGSVGSVSGAVGSVTGNVGGNVVGSVASVTNAVTVGTNNDKTGYALSAASIQAIWDALTSALTTVGSIGKLLVDNINATISSRLPTASYTAPDNASITTILSDTNDIQTRLPAALVGGRMDSSVGAMATDVITNTALAASAVTEIQSGLSTLTATQVNAEVVDALATDTYAEPASVPAATATLAAKIGWLMALARNKRTTTSTTDTIRNDADSGNIAAATISDDGTTFTRGEYT